MTLPNDPSSLSTPDVQPLSMTQTEPESPGAGRHIRSFVRRQGKMTSGQKRALERLSEEWTLPVNLEPIDLQQCFDRDAPVILEIGFGMGETTVRMAAAQVEKNFLGLEVYPAGVGSLLGRIESTGVKNIRILEQDAVEVLHHRLSPGSLEGVHLYFPDPWPKKRHHKRRLIQPEFAALLASRIRLGGYLHCATDWPDYAEQMLSVLNQEPLLRNQASDLGYSPKPDHRPETKFEARGIRLGNPVADLLYTRV